MITTMFYPDAIKDDFDVHTLNIEKTSYNNSVKHGQNILIVVLISIPISLFLNKKIFTFLALLFCFFIFSLSFYKFKTNVWFLMLIMVVVDMYMV